MADLGYRLAQHSGFTKFPLTFLVGVYGMNFTHMPEVDEPSAFWVLMGLMAAIAVGMLVFFRRKGWLGGDDDDDEP